MGKNIQFINDLRKAVTQYELEHGTLSIGQSEQTTVNSTCGHTCSGTCVGSCENTCSFTCTNTCAGSSQSR